MSARGIKKTNAKTITTTLKGRFNTDIKLMNGLLSLYK